jgi:hypothetical protein
MTAVAEFAFLLQGKYGFRLSRGPAPETGPQDWERTVRLDDRDRRRLMLASALTVAALPAVWLVNRDDDSSTRPNVAALGLSPGEAATSATPETVDPMGTVPPGFLETDTVPAAVREPVSAVIGTGEGATMATATAIFRHSVGDPRTCLFSGVPGGSHVTVVNVANDRSVDCWTALRPIDAPRDELVMSPATFAEIADPTTAPIHVEIRQAR